MAKSSFDTAKSEIKDFFTNSETKIWKKDQLSKIFNDRRAEWRLAKSMSFAVFSQKLIDAHILHHFIFPFPYRTDQRFAISEVPLLEVLQSLKAGAYYTHASAMVVHDLANFESPTIYLNHEQLPHQRSTLTNQSSLDAAFKNKPRVSNNIINIEAGRICMVNGMFTGELGVVTMATNALLPSENALIRVTNLERTMIDISVRPVYAGGIEKVLEAFKRARSVLRVENIIKMLEQLDYVYPYYQAIGWYLENAGYGEHDLSKFNKKVSAFNFYIAHQLRSPVLDKRWKLYVPNKFG